MKYIFQWLADILNGMERGVIDFLSALVPYAVPVIPAYLTYYHTVDMMNFPPWVAVTAAFVVETLGMASVSTTIKFWRNNQRYKADQNKAPFWLALGTYIFYLVIVMSVNVLLEKVSGTRSNAIIWAIGLFTSLSAPSGVLVSIRTQYSEMLEERKEKKAGGIQSSQQPKQQPREQKEKHASDHKDKIPAMLEAEYKKSGRVLSLSEITASLKLEHSKNKGYVSTMRTKWMNDNNITKPPFP